MTLEQVLVLAVLVLVPLINVLVRVLRKRLEIARPQQSGPEEANVPPHGRTLPAALVARGRESRGILPSTPSTPPVPSPARGRRPRVRASVLEAARMAGISIPALCHHPALPPDSSCRLCLVEVDGRPGFHAACVLPATNGLVVNTQAPAVQAERRNVLWLLLGRHRPGKGDGSDELLMLAARYGVTAPAEPWGTAPGVGLQPVHHG